ncbi:hypothetical protein DV735_g380, partial [Chaetothyriales sp. CBS 134920]
MASILRQIVAGPRARHPEAGLDLCYVTDHIVVTSGPSAEWPKKAYRNPVDQLVAFLDKKHGQDWCIFEFRAEGTGYPDSEVEGRVHHFPWPDHQPPPFAIRVAVVHCKAGKGRSGTVATAYLISEEGWGREDALQRFTARRMRAGFGQGVSIPSQLRYVGYVDRWANQLGKKYVDRPVEIVEVHIWGLCEGVKVAVDGYVDGGKAIKTFYTFTRNDTTVVDQSSTKASTSRSSTPAASRVIVPTSDVNIDFERRNRAAYAGFTVVTSIAHVWFNAYFEGGSDRDDDDGHGHESGVFEIDWDAMDGIKGSRQKGIQALDRLKVVWRYAAEAAAGHVVEEPRQGGSSPPEGPRADESKIKNTEAQSEDTPLADEIKIKNKNTEGQLAHV